MEQRIHRIIEHWFVQEPALFVVLCSHELVPNDKIQCPVRSGCGRVEYHPAFVREMSDMALEEALKTEAIRILLKHPYERRPDGCCDAAIAIGSNLAVADNYPFARFSMKTPDDYGFKTGLPYEMYARLAQPAAEGTGEGQRNAASDLSGLWQDDPLQIALINRLIDSIKDWGSLSGNLAERVKASTRAFIDWKKVLLGFRAQVLSSNRRLTRMKPSRRTGFDNMGSLREFTSKLLVALDVSGSISSECISYFLGVVNGAFKYGITRIDVIQFEMVVTREETLSQTIKTDVALGRGGTNFHAPIAYAAERDYDGMLILTDGCAPEPIIPEHFKTKILWVCESEEAYRMYAGWMSKYGRVCTMRLR